MNLEQFKQYVDQIYENVKRNHRDPSETNVRIKVHRLGTLGPTPTVDIDSVQLGFDWDKDVIIAPTETLREVNRDEIETLQKKYDDLGWSYYENSKRIKKSN